MDASAYNVTPREPGAAAAAHALHPAVPVHNHRTLSIPNDFEERGLEIELGQMPTAPPFATFKAALAHDHGNIKTVTVPLDKGMPSIYAAIACTFTLKTPTEVRGLLLGCVLFCFARAKLSDATFFK